VFQMWAHIRATAHFQPHVFQMWAHIRATAHFLS
jgi:hypothetical protein